MTDGLGLTVLGAGYLGITHAACMASLGFEVLGVDTDAARGLTSSTPGSCPSTSPAWKSSCGPGSAPGG